MVHLKQYHKKELSKVIKQNSNNSEESDCVDETRENSNKIENGQTTNKNESGTVEKAKTVNKPVKEKRNSNEISEKPKQESLRKFLKRKRKGYGAKSRKKMMLDEGLVQMIVLDYQPLSIVEDEGFQLFVNLLDDKYNIPSRNTVTYSLLPRYYGKVQEKLKILLGKVR